MRPGSTQAAALRAEAMRWQEALDSRAFLEAQVRSRTPGARVSALAIRSPWSLKRASGLLLPSDLCARARAELFCCAQLMRLSCTHGVRAGGAAEVFREADRARSEALRMHVPEILC